MCLQYKPLFDSYAAKTARPLSVYHFSSIYAWSDHFDLRFEEIRGQLCVFACQGKDSFLYLPPLGESIDPEVYRECFKRMGRRPIARVENIVDYQIAALGGSGYNAYQKSCEYVYRTKDIADLCGTAYKSKRHDVNLVGKSHPQARFREFTREDIAGCRGLYQRWADGRKAKNSDAVYVQMLEENALVHAKLMDKAAQLALVGRVVDIDGKIAGYTFGCALNDDTFCVVLEIADNDIAGLAAFTFNHFCRDKAVRDFTWINAMDDFGMPNVAKAKASYHPARTIAVYNIKENA